MVEEFLAPCFKFLPSIYKGLPYKELKITLKTGNNNALQIHILHRKTHTSDGSPHPLERLHSKLAQTHEPSTPYSLHCPLHRRMVRPEISSQMKPDKTILKYDSGGKGFKKIAYFLVCFAIIILLLGIYFLVTFFSF
jgi:hypothetical protein